MTSRSRTAQDALEQVAWGLRAVPVRAGSRLAPGWMARSARDATRVHLGCGPNVLDGWANLDVSGPRGVVRFDLSRPLPFESGSVDLIFTEHFVEHIRKDQAEALFRECARILRPGGVLRISTPDLRTLIDAYLGGRVDDWADMQWSPATPCDLLNEGMRLWGHRYLWDEDQLRRVLRSQGFTTVQRVAWHESDRDELRDLEIRPFHGDLIVEATM